MNPSRFGRGLAAAVLAMAVAGAVGYWLVVVQPAQALEDALPRVDLNETEPQVATAISSAMDSLRADGPSARAWARLAQLLHAHDFHAEAIAAYSNAMALDAGDYRWPYLAGLAQSKLDQALALPWFQTAAGLEPVIFAFYIDHGDLLMQLGELEPARAQYQEALARNSEASHALYGLARIALIDGDTGAAREYLARARDAAPGHGEVHNLLAQLFNREGNAEAATREEQLARVATSTRASNPVVAAMEGLALSSTARVRRGKSLANNGDLEAAEREFRQVLAIRSGYASDHTNLGSTLASQDRFDEAIAQFKLGLAIDPNDIDLVNNLGMTLANAGDLENGFAYLERVVAADPEFFPAQHNLGLLRERQGQLEQAVAHYREALRLNPAAAQVHNDLGSALAKLGNMDDAIVAWSDALALEPGSLPARYNLSVALIGEGNHADAIKLLREGRQRAPRSSRFVSLLAWELATAPDQALRNGPEALELARILLESAPQDPQWADLLAAALAENGQFDEALRTTQQALVALKSNPGPQSPKLMMLLQQRAGLYRQGQPYRQPR